MKMHSHVDIEGVFVPTFIYGTAWKENETERCVLDAVKCGFRAIDTANQRKHYFEAGVGNALLKVYEAGIVKREGLFLQTKFTDLSGQDRRLPYDAKADIRIQVLQSFESSLEHLHTDYLDSYILHGPSLRSGLGDQDWEVWRKMEEFCQSGKVKWIGISNVNLGQLKELCAKASVKPMFVQNRCFASTGWDRELRTFCSSNNILYQGFSLLTANPQVFRDRRFAELVQRHRRTPAQLIFRFAMDVGMLPITGTTNQTHMKEDSAVYDFELDASDVELIESINVEG